VVESAEPLAWERIELAVAQSAAIPLCRRKVAVDGAGFGSPDGGSFRYVGPDWTTSAELCVRYGAIGARLAHSWTLEVACPGARSVTVHVRIEASGSVTHHADGDGASPDPKGEGRSQRAVCTRAEVLGTPSGRSSSRCEGGRLMKIAVVYRPPALDAETYKATWASDVAKGNPEGLIFHAGVGE
jgi:hypothetical protein